MPGWKGIEKKIFPISRTKECPIHGSSEHYLMARYNYICSDCLREILFQLSGSVGGEPPQISLQGGVYQVEGMTPETLLELREKYVHEKIRQRMIPVKKEPEGLGEDTKALLVEYIEVLKRDIALIKATPPVTRDPHGHMHHYRLGHISAIAGITRDLQKILDGEV